MKKIAVFLLLFSFLLKISPAQIILVKPAEDETISNLPPTIRSFMELPLPERRKVFNDQEERLKIYNSRNGDPYPFTWENVSGQKGFYKIEISEKPDFIVPSQALVIRMWERGDENGADISNLKIGKTFYWRVVMQTSDGKHILSQVRKFKTDPFPMRLINLPDVSNTRDLGGKPGLAGKMIKQGMIYRSSGLNKDSPDYKGDKATKNPPNAKEFRIGEPRITSLSAYYVINVLKWRTELDLRNNGEVGGMESSPVGPQLKWIHRPSPGYSQIFKKKWADLMAANFRVFLDSNNYPINFHCISGADRTGSLAFILGGVLGVNVDELQKDWELSAYKSFTYKDRFDPLLNGFNKYGDANTPLVEKIENYLYSVGISEAEINTFRNLMLE